MKTCISKCLDASIVHASGTGQLQANPSVAGPSLSLWKPSRRAVTTMGSNDMFVGKTTCLDRVASGITRKRTGEKIAFCSSSRGGRNLISNPTFLRKYPFMKKISGDNLGKKSGVDLLMAVWWQTLSFLRQLPWGKGNSL